MTPPTVEQIANAVLYEGYLLYPYRPSSVKNQQRWTFGGVYPRTYSEAHGGSDAFSMQTECLVEGPSPQVTIRVRFLHLLQRTVGKCTPPLSFGPTQEEPTFQLVPRLQIEDRLYLPWQEARERDVQLDPLSLPQLRAPLTHPFTFPHSHTLEPLRDGTDRVAGVLVRTHQAIEASVQVSCEQLDSGLYRLRVTIENQTPLPQVHGMTRDEVQHHALVSTHTILTVAEGAFLSLMDPPEHARAHAEKCANVGTWPVLIGEPPRPSGTSASAPGRNTLLSSPIILYDYPEIAPESPGDLFDATEIDEILTLRILTLTEQEKQEMIAADDRARQLLERTEALAQEQLLGMHGRLRPTERGD